MPRHGHRRLRSRVCHRRHGSLSTLAHCTRRIAGKNFGTHRFFDERLGSLLALEGGLAECDQRSNMVDSFLHNSPECLPVPPTERRSLKLYPLLLNSRWPLLAEGIRDFHGSQGIVRGEGLFKIVRGPGFWGKCLAAWAGMPPSGEAVKTELKVVADAFGEFWERRFDGKVFTSKQRAEAGRLMERIRSVEFSLLLVQNGQDLYYLSEEMWLILGRWRLRIPKSFRPRIEGQETMGEEDHLLKVRIQVSSRWFGKILEYQGALNWRKYQ